MSEVFFQVASSVVQECTSLSVEVHLVSHTMWVAALKVVRWKLDIFTKYNEPA